MAKAKAYNPFNGRLKWLWWALVVVATLLTTGFIAGNYVPQASRSAVEDHARGQHHETKRELSKLSEDVGELNIEAGKTQVHLDNIYQQQQRVETIVERIADKMNVPVPPPAKKQ